ncbi:MAG TPA: DUF5996 family protein [Euzebyales bacterium]|nr:DUF5996 family protein [Euzebyales bacterium]
MVAGPPVLPSLPPMPLEAWADTKATLHRFAQIIGKIRLAASQRSNHWWNVPFHVTGSGITTRPMGDAPVFTIDFDFVDHRLVIRTLDGRHLSLPLAGHSVATFYRDTLDALAALGIDVTIERPWPFGLGDATPFAQDTGHAAYDPRWVTRYWQVLTRVALILEAFAARFSGKTSPVHHFWHTFDIAVTRFSERRIDHPPEVDPVTREAYSREVISSGFWFGDEQSPAPAFYSYTAPEPPGLATEPLQPAAAEWVAQNGSHLAVLRYDDVRAQADPPATALAFLERAYRAGARLAGWDLDALACPDGVTDPGSGVASDGPRASGPAGSG